MNKTFICMLIAWCTCLTGMAQNHFEKYFEKKTLRIDFALSGNAQTQSAAIQQMREEPVWGGPVKNLIDTFGYGGYYVNVYDKTGRELIYSRGFNTLFEEWRTTAQAKMETQAWNNSVCIPYPKDKVIVELTARDKSCMQFHPLLKVEVDPTSIFIDRAPLRSNPVTKLQYKVAKLQLFPLVGIQVCFRSIAFMQVQFCLMAKIILSGAKV